MREKPGSGEGFGDVLVDQLPREHELNLHGAVVGRATPIICPPGRLPDASTPFLHQAITRGAGDARCGLSEAEKGGVAHYPSEIHEGLGRHRIFSRAGARGLRQPGIGL
jgi:hypothetical protein